MSPYFVEIEILTNPKDVGFLFNSLLVLPFNLFAMELAKSFPQA